MPSPVTHLTTEQIDAFGAELDDLRRRTVADLGERDREYLEKVVRAQRGLEFAGRALLFAGFLPPAWVGGVTALSLSKILDNMEIGHNVMHGQYDFLQDPAFDGNTFEWDTACPADQWRHSHNFQHHTFTNIRGKDRDIGYGILRMTEEQKWKASDLGNPVYAFLLATFFQYGVMAHDLELDQVVAGKKDWSETAELLPEMGKKLGSQTLKDYVLFPLLTGPSAPLTFMGNMTANLARNLWTFTIIFCGHFPDGVATFTQEEADEESRGGWYLRQLLGSANITGSKLFHVMTGNLSHQIEHHLFPDIPAHRYPEMAVEVQEICERYGLPYNSGGLAQQFGSVVAKICKLALPWSGSPTGRPAVEPAVQPVVEVPRPGSVGTVPTPKLRAVA
ncbi:acyl-CoA desaturase [Aquihabitans sp. G128]|uniref:fatty acid desaturase family protein n=1 Tax=Aquihabitans sp. G128 TaxID=2849779 RepID=UPI001C21837B|nr:acyl-CoA desaturase [Aquihabitans sp. G128]QXC59295.1 acyl-CoA desaturase [Aquihabitans sp. G128]